MATGNIFHYTKTTKTGQNLMEDGLEVILKKAPDVAVFKYKWIN
jgi:hypothetical protein